jgi:NhaP-type Na+/H+ or K+/H+ antiporter
MNEVLLWCVYVLVVCAVMLQGITVWFLVKVLEKLKK